MNDRNNKEFKHTPGPWSWSVNETCKTISLMGWKDGSRHHVMNFKRYGMQSGQPSFEEDGIMHNSTKYFSMIKGQEHNSSWNKTIKGNANAQLIASSPKMLDVLIKQYEWLVATQLSYNPSEMLFVISEVREIIEEATGLSIQEVLEIVSTRRANAIREVASNGI